MKYPIKQKKSHKKILYIIVGVFLVTMISCVVFWKLRDNNSFSSNPDATITTYSGLNLSPPTKTDKEETEQHKEDLSNQTPKPTSGTVTPIFIDASQYDSTFEVRAYIPDITENGGTCTYLFSKDGKTFTKQSAAFADATTTACKTVEIPVAEFASNGTWSLKLTYVSSKFNGSTVRDIEVGR